MNYGKGIHVDADGYIGATNVGHMRTPRSKPIKTAPAGRRCTCGAFLSEYNLDDVCAPCSGERWAEH